MYLSGDKPCTYLFNTRQNQTLNQSFVQSFMFKTFCSKPLNNLRHLYQLHVSRWADVGQIWEPLHRMHCVYPFKVWYPWLQNRITCSALILKMSDMKSTCPAWCEARIGGRPTVITIAVPRRWRKSTPWLNVNQRRGRLCAARPEQRLNVWGLSWRTVGSRMLWEDLSTWFVTNCAGTRLANDVR